MDMHVNPNPDDEVNTAGSRHILQLLTHIAHTEPNRTYASIPKSTTDLSLGFRDICYAEFLDAIDHCVHFLHRILPVAEEPFEVVAYAGLRDIRYSILACALAKLEKRFLFISTGATLAGQTHLVQATGCKIFLYGGTFEEHVQSVIRGITEWHVLVAGVPDVEGWISSEKAEEWRWDKSWAEVRHTPWFIMHSSGTTGFPKPIEYTHQMMVSMDSVALMPDADKESIITHIPGRRWYSPLLTMHMVGMYVALQCPIILGGVAVFGHPHDPSPTLIRDTLRYGNCQGIISPPFFIEALAAEPLGLATLRGLDYIYFAGAPLSDATAEKLNRFTPVLPGMGTSEAGMYFILKRDDEDWAYYTFRPSNGIEFDRLDEDLYELVWRRKPELARWQQVFQLFPDQDEVRTGDVWVEHKAKPGAWKMVGRTDDLIVFSHGRKMNAAQIQMELGQCPGVGGVVVGGQSRPRPFVLVEWAGAGVDDRAKLEQLWPAMERINSRCAEPVRMQRELVLFTAGEKKLARNVKGDPAPKASEALYAAEIERLYEGVSL